MINTKILYSLYTLIFCLPYVPSMSYAKKSSLIGTQAPHFSLPDQTGTEQSLATFLGKKIALCFYPKDNSLFCTKQLCSIRDGFSQLKDHAITVIGISPDSPVKHKNFQSKQTLPFLLLSDPYKKVARLYHATYHWLNPIRLLGFTKRTTILIDEQGFIVSIIDNVNVSNHAQQIINAFDKAKKNPNRKK